MCREYVLTRKRKKKAQLLKDKVTLTVSKDVLKKAKALGINLSGTIEMALKGFTFDRKYADENAVRTAYDQLFKPMTVMLRQYGASMKIAELPVYEEEEGDNKEEGVQSWWLVPCPIPRDRNISEGSYLIFDQEEEGTEVGLKGTPLEMMLPPEELMTSFVDGLVEAAEGNARSLAELALAKRVIAALCEPHMMVKRNEQG